MNRPGITVVTVALNAAADLPLTIESVLGQTYPEIEYLVVDGLSHDATGAVLDRYDGRIDRVLHYEDGGIYDAMNFAAREAANEYILFLNAGDRFYSADAIEALFERRQGNPDVFYGDHVYVEGRTERHMPAADFGQLRQVLQRGAIDRHWHLRIPCHQATVTRTSLLRKLAYDTRYTICADHDFLFRAWDAGATFQYIDEIVAHYMAGGFSGAQGVLIHREWAHAYRKHSLRPLDVDRFFFETAAASPFPSRTRYSGLVLQGAHAEEPGLEPGTRWRWVDEELTLAAPSRVPAIGIAIKGRSRDAEQMLGFSRNGALLGGAMIGEGPFALRAGFVEPLLPGQSLAILSAQAMPLSEQDGRMAGWGFTDLHFLPCTTLAQPELDIAVASADLLDAVLIDGWSAPEPELGLVWSEEEQASIAVDPGRGISRLTLVCAANPCVAGGQELAIVVNGQLAGAFLLEAAEEPATCEVDVAALWRDGPNVIRVCVDQVAHVAPDPRRLGVALHRISWR